MLWLIIAIFALFGLVFGSFANVIIWRLPRKESLSYPASHCPRCNTPLKPYDNIPVISYLILGGKCRACQAPISPRYPIVELISGLLFALAPLLATNIVQAVFVAAFLYLLLVLSWIDFDTRLLPNKLVLALGIFGVFGVALSYIQLPATWSFSWAHPATVMHSALPFFARTAHSSALLDALLGVIISCIPAFLLALFYEVVRKKQGFGMGDIKLLAVLGLFLGWYGVFILPVAAIFALGAIVIGTFLNKKVSLSTQIPFGPFIAIGSMAILMGGPQLWTWYMNLFV